MFYPAVSTWTESTVEKETKSVFPFAKLKGKMTNIHHLFMLSGELQVKMSVCFYCISKVVGLRMTCCLEGGQSRPALQSHLGLPDLGHIVLAENCSCLMYPGWSIRTFYTRKTLIYVTEKCNFSIAPSEANSTDLVLQVGLIKQKWWRVNTDRSRPGCWTHYTGLSWSLWPSPWSM